jgi:flagellar hook-associated protein 3 FlgL
MITSTYTMTASLRRSLSLLQSNLARSQKELSSGRHADLALSLGSRTSRSFTLVATKSAVDTTVNSNAITAMRLDATQTTLEGLLVEAQDMRKTLISAQPNDGDAASLVSKAGNALASLIAKGNSADASGYLFGGINSDQVPINDYFAATPSPAKTALDSAFSAAFGFPQSSGPVSGITAAQMQSFLTGSFDQLFSAANWKANWSTASDKVQRSQINLSVAIDTSVSANDPALQQLAKAYAMLGDLGADRLSKSAYDVVLKTATDTLNAGIDALMKTQSRVGVMQNAVKSASDMMKLQQDTITQQLTDLEGVDSVEAGSRVQGLMTQIETAYTLTTRISQLTLTKYL